MLGRGIAGLAICALMGASLSHAEPLPFPDGRYVAEPEICRMSEEEMTMMYGDRTGMVVRSIQGKNLNDGYEMSCTIADVRVRGDDVQFRARCDSEGEDETVNGKYVRLTPTSFKLGNRVFARCPTPKPDWKFPEVTWPAESIVNLWDIVNTDCRGTDPSNPRMHTGCEARDNYYSKMLADRDWCYGREGEAGYQMRWHPCGPDSNRDE